VSAKNSKFITVVLMVLMMVSQPVTSAAVSYSMTMGSSNIAMNDDNSSCHDEEDFIVQANIIDQINAIDKSSTIDKSLDIANDDSNNCCDVECHCPSGHCSTAALPLDGMPSGCLHSLPQNSEFLSQWIVSQSLSSLYRPPISL